MQAHEHALSLCILWSLWLHVGTYHPSLLQGRVDLVVEDAQSGEGNDAGDDQLGQVVVVEDVVDVQPQVGREDSDQRLVERLGWIRLGVESGNELKCARRLLYYRTLIYHLPILSINLHDPLI